MPPMKHLISIPLLLALSAVPAAGVPATPAFEAITSAGCNFTVRFPVKTDRQSHLGTEGLWAQSVYDERNPLYLRAECTPVADSVSLKTGLRSLLERQARQSGVDQPQISIEYGPLGTIGTYAGFKRLPGLNSNARYVGKVVVGTHSVLHLIALDAGPVLSSQAITFFDSVELKPPAAVADDPQRQHAEQIGQMVGAIVGSKSLMETMIEHCQTRLPALQISSAQALSRWSERNRVIAERADQLSENLQKTLYGERSFEEGKNVKSEALAESREKLRRSLERAPTSQLKCEEFIQSVDAGQMDLEVLHKDAVRFIREQQFVTTGR